MGPWQRGQAGMPAPVKPHGISRDVLHVRHIHVAVAGAVSPTSESPVKKGYVGVESAFVGADNAGRDGPIWQYLVRAHAEGRETQRATKLQSDLVRGSSKILAALRGILLRPGCLVGRHRCQLHRDRMAVFAFVLDDGLPILCESYPLCRWRFIHLNLAGGTFHECITGGVTGLLAVRPGDSASSGNGSAKG